MRVVDVYFQLRMVVMDEIVWDHFPITVSPKVLSNDKVTLKKNARKQNNLFRRVSVNSNQARIKGTEKASPLHTLFHR